jgi:hypothetical protein
MTIPPLLNFPLSRLINRDISVLLTQPSSRHLSQSIFIIQYAKKVRGDPYAAFKMV